MNTKQPFSYYVKSLFVDQAFFHLELKARCIYDMYKEIVDVFFKDDFISYDEKQIIINKYIEKENTITTYVGNHTAIPHICYRCNPSISVKIGWFRSTLAIPAMTKSKQTIKLFLCVIAPDNLTKLCSVGLELLNGGVLLEDLLKADTLNDMKLSIVNRIYRLWL